LNIFYFTFYPYIVYSSQAIKGVCNNIFINTCSIHKISIQYTLYSVVIPY
jgi:hypothetical protein